MSDIKQISTTKSKEYNHGKMSAESWWLEWGRQILVFQTNRYNQETYLAGKVENIFIVVINIETLRLETSVKIVTFVNKF